MNRPWPILYLLAFPPLVSASAEASADTTKICLAPATVESAVGNSVDAANAVRESFTSFLTGPSLAVQPLNARLQSQVREEAKGAGCRYLLLPTVKHEHKSGGGGLLGRMAGGAVEQGAWRAGAAAGTTVGGVAAGAAAGAAGAAVNSYASSVRNKDELTLSYKLESAEGKALLDKSEKRKAKSDGEDLLTPLVQHASEAVAGAVKH